MSGIVVGVDGSEGAQHALEWAAAEAKLRAVPLTVVSLPGSGLRASTGCERAGVITPELTDDFGEFAERRLEQACEEAGYGARRARGRGPEGRRGRAVAGADRGRRRCRAARRRKPRTRRLCRIAARLGQHANVRITARARS